MTEKEMCKTFEDMLVVYKKNPQFEDFFLHTI